MNVSDRLLLAYLTGALEPSRRQELSEHIDADTDLQRRLRQLSERLGGQPPARWRIPPPAIRGVPWMMAARVERSRHAVLGAEEAPELVPGQPFQLRLPQVESPSSWRVVVLYRQSGDWEVVFPTWPDDDMTLADLPMESNGELRLDLIARPEAGRQRWAMALLPLAFSIDWDAPEDRRWAPLQDELARGEIQLAVIEVEVSS